MTNPTRRPRRRCGRSINKLNADPKVPEEVPAALVKELEARILNDVVLYNVYTVYLSGRITWSEAMTHAALALSKKNADLFEQLVRLQRRVGVSRET